MRRIAALAATIALAVALGIIATIGAVPALGGTTVPPLNGESFYVIAGDNGTIDSRSVDCHPAGTSTIAVTFSGVASGPYPGPFTESLTATVGPQTVPDRFVGNTGFAGVVTSLSGQLTILSAAGTVNGSEFLSTSFLYRDSYLGACESLSDVGFLFLPHVLYEARISTPFGTATDSGATFPIAGTYGSSAGSLSQFFYNSTGTVFTGPATVALSPLAGVNNIGTSHTVTATARDAGGAPVAGTAVLFTVSGAVSTTGSCTTNSAGQCSFTYQGPRLPGSDVITGCADTNGNGVVDPGEPCGAATKAWVGPATTDACKELGFQQFGLVFKNQGDCVSFVATGGRNLPSGG